MTNGNEYSLDSLRFLQEFNLNPPLSDSVKLDTLVGEVREIKVMLSQLLALNSKSSLNSSSLGPGSYTAGARSLLTTPASFEVLNDEFKLMKLQVESLATVVNVPIPRAENILYDMSTAEENREARWKDASDRYDKTNVVINLLCETKFSGEDNGILSGKASVEFDKMSRLEKLGFQVVTAINKIIYLFNRDDMESAKIWFEEKLQPKDYLIFRGDLQNYSSNDSLFALGFMSPFQKERLVAVNIYCLDATYFITKRTDEILYTIVIRDNHPGRSFPCGYMITNDHSLGPIVQWLQFLKNKGVIVDPLLFTIDCSDSEMNAINNFFSGCSIQYCLFHVSQAWNRQLVLKVKAVSGIPADNRILRSEVYTYLKMTLYEVDKDVFHARIAEFISRYEATQTAFINYFRFNWCDEAKYNLWSRAYRPVEFSHMLTNSYIESWHNQLKYIFLGRSRNKRLDRLIFILTVEVEYFYEEFDRVESEMITSPSGSNDHVDFDNVAVADSGNWIIDSFIDDNSAYVVFVDDDVSCQK
ncbi:hypothetical protein INT48_005377 [Thamnidium elegans]|uniref:MULE transposase domain-containing protein n=1 Tax=Thamnidium elegans TaxID=101142 RepID=A0A8H7VVI3_9FUNG|nr:hypothetical protein INT48_005377 [Thamnidium elegans]